MYFEDEIPRHSGVKVCITREDFDHFCDGDCCAGNLISYFEFWHKKKKMEAYKRVSEGLQEEVTEQDLYQHQSIEEMVVGIRGTYNRDYVIKAVRLLINKGVLRQVKLPNRNKNLSTVYLFNPEPVKLFVNLYYENRKFVVEKSTASRSRKIDCSNRETKSKETNIKASSLLQKDVTKNNEQARSVLIRRKSVEQEVKKPTLIKRKQSLFPSKEVESLFKYWNSLRIRGKTDEDPKTKTFQTAVQYIAEALKHHNEDQIKESMTLYHKLIASPHTLLKTQAPGNVVNIVDFFKFTKMTSERIIKYDKEKLLDYLDCWFDECMKGWDFLSEHYLKKPKFPNDTNKAVTIELMKDYRNRVNGNQITTDEVNMFIVAATKLMDYHNNMKSKLKFTSCPIEKDDVVAFAHHMIDACLEKTTDKTIINIGWLLTDNHIKSRLPEHFKRLGMLDKCYEGSKSDTLTEDALANRKKEIEGITADFQAKVKVERSSDRTIEEQEKNIAVARAFMERCRTEIMTRYGDNAKPSKSTEDIKVSNLLYDDEE